MSGRPLVLCEIRRALLLTSVAGAVIACAHSGASASATAAREAATVSGNECYALTYSDTSARGSGLFPTWIELRPGMDSGRVVGHRHPSVSEADWNALLKYTGWKKIPGDSLEIMFTGSFEGIRMHAAHSNDTLSGQATWLTDVVGLATPSLEFVGTRTSC